MIKNYLTVALRNLLRHKAYSLINIIGLAIGITCCILITLFVMNELNYDRYPERADQIYRLIHSGRGGKDWACLPAPVAPELHDAFPEIETVRLFPQRHVSIRREDKISFEDICFADPNVFEVFSFSLLKGKPGTALSDPYSIVITEKASRKYFGLGDPIGKVLTYDDKYDFTITGILKNIPETSHFIFDFLASFETLQNFQSINVNGRMAHQFYTYLLLPETISPVQIQEFGRRFIEKAYHDESRFVLQPLGDIHLYSHLEKEMNENSDIAYVYIFCTTALLVLAIASINFMNLATARSINRSREVGLRKVVGAHRLQLVKQFLVESVLLSILASALAVILVELSLPTLNSFLGKSLALSLGSDISVLFFIIGFSLSLGVVSGAYPALYLSAFQPVDVLKGPLRSGRRGILFRRGLVVSQFAISIILIIATSVISDQLNHIRSKNLGFSKEEVFVIPMSKTVRNRYDVIKQELLGLPKIVSVSASDRIPGTRISMGNILVEDQLGQERIPVRIIWADYDFIETLGIEISRGRDFSRDFVADPEQSFIVNEAAIEAFGWESPVGKQMLRPFVKRVIGVVENFNYASLHQTVEPLVIQLRPSIANYILVRSRTGSTFDLLSSLRNVWSRLNQNVPFEYSRLGDYFVNLYRLENSAESVLRVFSLIAVAVASMGLLGLVSFSVEQRNKEMGVRKVLGASTFSIIQEHTKEFLNLVVLANLISWPVAYFITERWLQDFAYRIEVGMEPFFLASVVALLAASATVSYHSIRSAASNPINALRQ